MTTEGTDGSSARENEPGLVAASPLTARYASEAGDSASNDFDDTQHVRKFWSRFLQVGLIVLVGETLATLVYCFLTHHGAHRIPIIWIVSVTLIAVIVAAPFIDRIASSAQRTRFAFIWTLIAGVIATLSAHLDGGVNSPLIFMLILPIASAGIALPVREVTICAGATLAELAVVWLSDPHVRQSTADTAVFATALVGLTILAVGASGARARMQDDESRLRSALSVLAHTDALTGCLNHGAFYERLDGEVNRALRQNEPLSLLMIDVDQFKSFNDAHGHVAGDEVLSRIGTTLRNQSRSFDVVGRVGGDEFAVMLPTSDAKDAATIAQRVSASLVSNEGPRVTASVGYATMDASRPSAKQLVREADTCLYEVKSRGGHRTSRSSRV